MCLHVIENGDFFFPWHASMVEAEQGARRVWVCDVDGCGKTYVKQARLLEHQRVHTGERPFVCEHCGASYMRSTHLAAHMRTHMDESMKPLACPRETCTKRFWTQQHLRRHVLSCHAMESGVHSMSMLDAEAALGVAGVAGLYHCDSPGCDLVFSKRKHLYQHRREAHADPSCSHAPFVCDVCDKHFLTNAKRRHHMRIHEEGRYQCILPHAVAPLPPEHPPHTDTGVSWSFATWTHLQRHMRLCHPPTCPVCGRAFASREKMRRHQHTHAPREPLVCPWNGCDKAFQRASSLRVHISRVHHGERPFVCKVCGQSFGYKHLLQRHEHTHAKCEHHQDTSHVGQLKRKRARVLPCPWDKLGSDSCPKKFARLYDVRRHLASVHGLSLSDAELCTLMPEEPRAIKRPRAM